MNPKTEVVQQHIQKLIENINNAILDETYQQNELESPQAKLARINLQSEEMLKELNERLEKGWHSLYDELSSSNPEQVQELAAILNFTPEKWKELLEPKKPEAEMLPLYRRFGIPDPIMERLYKTASSLLGKEKYPEAVDGFAVLTILDPTDYWHWMGYGLAKQWENEDADGALAAYTVASILDTDAPLPYLHMAECLIDLDDQDDALSFLNIAMNLAGDDESYDLLRERCTHLKTLITGG